MKRAGIWTMVAGAVVIALVLVLGGASQSLANAVAPLGWVVLFVGLALWVTAEVRDRGRAKDF